MTPFHTWLAAHVAAFDDAALERWCGPLLLARARADLAAAPPAIELAPDRVTVRTGADSVEVTRAGVPGCTCTCPARTCRHRALAALALREHLPSTRRGTAQATTARGDATDVRAPILDGVRSREAAAPLDTGAPSGPTPSKRAGTALAADAEALAFDADALAADAEALALDAEAARARFGAKLWKRAETARAADAEALALDDAALAADAEALALDDEAFALDADAARARFGAKLWKRAETALARGVVVELRREAAGLTASFAGTGVSCTFHAQLPLELATCSCRKPFPCEHRAIAIAARLAGRSEAPDVCPAPPPGDVRVPAAVHAPIAALCAELVATGLDHAHAGWVRAAVRLAVVAHAARLPRLERELEDLAEQLELARRRSARFELRACAIAIARIALRVRLLASRPVDHELAGSFHRTYLDAGPLVLACVGAQPFTTADGVDGVRLHFHDGTGFAVATIATDRPSSTPWRPRSIRFDRPLWGAARWQDLVGARLRLDNARRAADGAIASSPATRAAILDRFDACALDVGAHRVDDWRTLADRVSAAAPFPIGDPAPPIVAIAVPRAIERARRSITAVEADAVDAGGRRARLVLPARRGNAAARDEMYARLVAGPPSQILAAASRERAGLRLVPIAFYRRGEPIASLGLGAPVASLPSLDVLTTTSVSDVARVGELEPDAAVEARAEPLDDVWRWLEGLVAAGLGAPRVRPAPASPLAALAPLLDRADRDPAALLAAIAAAAVADDVEGHAALASAAAAG